jgi:hypothetical protein
VSETTGQRLLQHAGLVATPDRSPLVDGCLASGEINGPRFDDALEDLIQTLQRLNTELNGEVPSKTFSNSESVPRPVAYSISEITRTLRGASLLDTAAIVDIAWNAVLAGDIDDIRIHLEGERLTRPAR